MHGHEASETMHRLRIQIQIRLRIQRAAERRWNPAEKLNVYWQHWRQLRRDPDPDPDPDPTMPMPMPTPCWNR